MCHQNEQILKSKYVIFLVIIISQYANGNTNPFHITLENHPVIRSNVDIHGETICEEQFTSLLIMDYDSGVNVLINSESSLVISLSHTIPEDLTVLLVVKSDEKLITFEDPELKPLGNESYSFVYKANVAGDKIFKYKTLDKPGHAEIILKLDKGIHDVDLSMAFLSINIARNSYIDIIISILGWTYFLAWSVSFYPQVFLNFNRKSVRGLSLMFLFLNLIGFASYSMYNISMLYSRGVREQYFNRYKYSRIPVETNDMFFSIHATIITLVTIFQYFIYERDEGSSRYQLGILGTLVVFIEGLPCLLALFNVIQALDVLFVLSTVKLLTTLVKYIPQAYLNYKRQSTEGWSIHNILLDFSGGVLSLGQMFLLAYNYNDWIAIFGNFTKFGLAIASISFDILFFIQHYVLYKNTSSSLENISESP